MTDGVGDFARLGISLGLGLLVGLQRERTDARLAGFRTFPLVTGFGALCGLLARDFGGWILAAGLVALGLVIVAGGRWRGEAEGERPGVTTEVAVLVMFAVGAYLMAGSPALAMTLGGVVAVLLHLKPQLHSLAARIGERDFRAIMQFVVISLVILPVVPDRNLGPYAVLNPFRTWLMVVLIVGLSLGGYVAYRVLGERAGSWAGGVLGGLISSTATTVTVARRSRQGPTAPALAAFVILLASAVVFARVSILAFALAPHFARTAVGPLGIVGLVLALAAWGNLRRHAAGGPGLPEPVNPTELKPALAFGVSYALIQLGVAAAQDHFGRSGLLVAAALSGLTDMDAIALSVTQMAGDGRVAAGTGWRLLLVAALSNLGFKAGVVAVLGDRRVLGRVLLGFGVAGVAGGLLLAFGPA